MEYKMTIAGLERSLPLCKVSDDLYIGAFVIFGDPELTTACAEELLKRAPEYDYMLTAEAKGIPLIHEMARLAGNRKYFLARKKAKLYMRDVFEVSVDSITTEGSQKLYLDGSDAELMKGKRILLVDDVISTEESMAALEKLVEKAGGAVCGRMAILAEGDSQKRGDILLSGASSSVSFRRNAPVGTFLRSRSGEGTDRKPEYLLQSSRINYIKRSISHE